MTPDERTAEKVLADVMAGCFGDPPHDPTAFRWRVVQAIAAAFQAEREACAQIVADVRGRWGGDGGRDRLRPGKSGDPRPRRSMTPDERTARKIVQDLLGPGGQGEELGIQDIAAALVAERERCLAEFDRLVEKYGPSDQHICPAVLKGAIATLRLLAAPCATAP